MQANLVPQHNHHPVRNIIPDLQPRNQNTWVHLNVQMSGDSRIALGAVGMARKHSVQDEHHGVIVSAPKGSFTQTDDVNAKRNWVDQRLGGLLTTHNVKNHTLAYQTDADDPHKSRGESLGDWRTGVNRGDTDYRRSQQQNVHRVFQTGGIGRLIERKENQGTLVETRLRGSLVADYQQNLPDATQAPAKPLVDRFTAQNNRNTWVFWFKGDPRQSDPAVNPADVTARNRNMNTIQQAKTEHWLSADAALNVVNTRGGGEWAIAGSPSAAEYQALRARLPASAMDATVGALRGAGYQDLGQQYGFFASFASNMVHFGGRSGHLEPLGAMGIKTRYFEEAGNGQADRELAHNRGNQLERITLQGSTSAVGLQSLAHGWLAPTGYWREMPDNREQEFDVEIARIRRQLGPVNNADRADFYRQYLAQRNPNVPSRLRPPVLWKYLQRDGSWKKVTQEQKNQLEQLAREAYTLGNGTRVTLRTWQNFYTDYLSNSDPYLGPDARAHTSAGRYGGDLTNQQAISNADIQTITAGLTTASA